MKKLLGYLELTRPQNNFIAALSVLVGAAVSGEVGSWGKVLFACLSAFFISAGGNTINDFFDVEIDRINKPNRPLPRGEIHPSSALLFSVLLFLLGILLSFLVKPLSILMALAASGLLAAYSSFLKKRFLWGNLTVSLVAALAFVYGGITTTDFRLSLIPAVFAFLFHLGREVLKDVEDLKGDLSWGASTLPVRMGADFALRFSGLVFLFLIALTPLPYVFHFFSFLYLVLVILGVDLIMVCVVWLMWRNASSPSLRRLSNILKADMLLGLLAIYLGRF